MSESKHTPGPWAALEPRQDKTDPRIGPFWTVPVCVGTMESAGNALATVHLGGRGALDTSREAVKANAILIASAPDLLAALKEVVAISDRKHNAWDAAKAVIARAEGTDQ